MYLCLKRKHLALLRSFFVKEDEKNKQINNNNNNNNEKDERFNPKSIFIWSALAP